MSNYVYIRSEPGLWTVGFYKPSGEWEAESDHNSPQKAADRAMRLNGGPVAELDTLRAAHADDRRKIVMLVEALEACLTHPGLDECDIGTQGMYDEPVCNTITQARAALEAAKE